MNLTEDHGIYIHIPFCRTACSYCDFHFSTQTRYSERMCKAITEEIRKRSHEWENKKFVSIYFGGGTPGLMNEKELNYFFDCFDALQLRRYCKEITLEVNPENVSPDNITLWNRLGINRISIGIQSFLDLELQWMRRPHTVEDCMNALELLTQGFNGNITADLIFGTPNLTLDSLKKQLDILFSFRLSHLSCYQLTVENRTLLKKEVEQKKHILPDDDIVTRQFLFIHEYCSEHGFEHYEISNYARPGHRAIHNSLYWFGNSYSGFGPSAHSYDGKTTRRINVANNHVYMQGIENNISVSTEESLNQKELWNEFVLTRLRTSEGINFTELRNFFGVLYYNNLMKKISLMNEEWFRIQSDRVVLTPPGMILADFITSELFLV